VSSAGIVLLAHGSRDAHWRRPIEAVRARIEAECALPARCAYLELCPPTLADAVAELDTLGARRIAILPLFLGMGRHVREDLPRRVQELARALPHLQLRLQAPIGEDERVIDLMARLASDAAAASAQRQ
jgi:sirohydrochlorin cobaltochelatase